MEFDNPSETNNGGPSPPVECDNPLESDNGGPSPPTEFDSPLESDDGGPSPPVEYDGSNSSRVSMLRTISDDTAIPSVSTKFDVDAVYK